MWWKLVPTWAYGLLALLVMLAAVGFWQYNRGQQNIIEQMELEAAALQEIVNELQTKQAVVTTKIEYRTVEKVREVKVKGEEREKIVYRYIPAGTPELPAGFRVYHDAAATSTVPDSASIADAAPVPVEDAASTINYNYTQCHAAMIQVKGWQDWYKEQKEAYESFARQSVRR